MDLIEYNKKADEYTAKASEIIRQLAFGGIAIIWLFKTTINGKDVIDRFLIYPLAVLALTLLIDLFQYLLGAIIWKRFFRREEQKRERNNVKDADVRAPKKLSAPLYILFGLKSILMLTSYILIVIFLFNKIGFQ
jgi:hypothetical protein